MPNFRFGRTQKALTLAPLAVASAVWTGSLVSVTPTSASADETAQESSGKLPDGTTVPTESIEAPASVTNNQPTNSRGMVKNASTNGIPAPALSAYQRAETVINAADKDCNVPWQLVAAIGRVESDHGRYGGNVLDGKGVSRPGIYGIALNGSNDTQSISDTDAGQLDNDKKFDRAVGPMQFIPSTWSVVGVDADNDGERNPQDIDDAALATAVYLCSGNDDLSAEKGQREAVYRYNHSQEYVDLVLSIMKAYMSGDYTSVPAETTSAGYITKDPDYVAPDKRSNTPIPTGPGGNIGNDNGSGSSGNNGSNGSNDGGGSTPAEPAPPTQPPAPQPPEPQNPVPSIPVPSLPNPPKIPKPPKPELPEPVQDVVTRAEALAKCTAQGIVNNPLTAVNELERCITRTMG